MFETIKKIEDQYKKAKVPDVRSGDTVRVHQRIKEGSKERIQIFEGLVIKTSKLNSLQARIHVRRISSGVGVEKSFMLHSPLIEKVEIVKRSKVRRNYISYMRNRSGKSARLSSVDFDSEKANDVSVPEDTSKEAKLAAAALEETEKQDPQAKAHEEAKQEAKANTEMLAAKPDSDEAKV
ncbi:50S ribosomal protein L19 [Candidatus Saccharibacteria bacterium]|jgi:large subunit ribosomal protein L19|nr:50S ribosomal protein L19 [Candidatus Saccharibacteria bacterium]